MLRLGPLLPSARAQHGFTLVEVLVAMVTGIVVSLALFAILDFSVRESGRLSNVAQATQLGRGTMTRIVEELHSACIAPKFKPVQSGSSESKLILISGYGEKAEVPTKATSLTGVREDEISWSGPAENTQQVLTDKTMLGTGISKAGVYEFAAPVPASGVQIGTRITESEKAPIFKYYEYATAVKSGTTEASQALTPVALTKGAALTVAQAETVAGVEVTFNAAPSQKELKPPPGLNVDQSTLATFSFSAPNSEATIKAGPCE
jgi:Tfp pilus assembly protein PilV